MSQLHTELSLLRLLARRNTKPRMRSRQRARRAWMSRITSSQGSNLTARAHLVEISWRRPHHN